MSEKSQTKAVVLDFNRTVYDPDVDKLIPGAMQLIEELSKRVPLALYCKTSVGREEKIEALGIKQYFKKILFVKEKGPEDLLKIAEELRVKPQEMVVIGDRIQTEIAAAKKAGCKTIWFRNGKFADELPTNPEEEPDHTITELKQAVKGNKGFVGSARIIFLI